MHIEFRERQEIDDAIYNQDPNIEPLNYSLIKFKGPGKDIAEHYELTTSLHRGYNCIAYFSWMDSKFHPTTLIAMGIETKVTPFGKLHLDVLKGNVTFEYIKNKKKLKEEIEKLPLGNRTHEVELVRGWYVHGLTYGAPVQTMSLTLNFDNVQF